MACDSFKYQGLYGYVVRTDKIVFAISPNPPEPEKILASVSEKLVFYT